MILSTRVKQGAALAALIFAAVLGYWKGYAQPRDRRATDLSRQLAAIDGFESALADRPRVHEALKRLAADTLGTETDQATARFRTALGEIGRDCGLTVSAVNSQEPERVGNPAGAKVKTTVGSDLRKQLDFMIIRGQLAGAGNLDQVLRTIATVQAQPWVHRVESFSLKPEDADHQRFALTLGVATVLMPDLAPKDLQDPRIIPLDPMVVTRWAGIARKNPFREPPLQVAKADAPQPPAPPPAVAPPPWGEWKLTGVIETRRRVEALMVNTRTQESKVLNVGSSVSGATLLSGARDAAVFDIGGQHFEVQIGQTLDQRSPAGR